MHGWMDGLMDDGMSGWMDGYFHSKCNLDLKEAEVGWQNELVTTKKCKFSEGKTNDSIVVAQHGE